MSSKRQYYKSSDGQSTSKYKMFLVKYHNLDENSFLCDGPYGDMEEAIKTVNEYLKEGICSWMVSYND